MSVVVVTSKTPAAKDKNVRRIVSQVGKQGRIFTTEFIKRDGSEVRVLPGRLNVVSALKGGEAKYDATEKGLFRVFDMGTGGSGRGYKAIPTEGVLEIRSGGKTYKFEDDF
jgi:hypothetical protein